MRRISPRLRQQRGQVLVLFAAMFAIITVVGFLVVDFGLWYSERRGAQTDADLPALAGARECMLQLATGVPHDPLPAIQEWFAENNPQGTSLYCDESGDDDRLCIVRDKTSTQCQAQDNGELCVDVVVRHKSQNLFSKLSFFNNVFDDVAGNIGAHARACAGAANNPAGKLPLEISTNGPCYEKDGETPNLGAICPIKFDSAGTPETGLLDLLASGACSQWSGPADIQTNFEEGTSGICNMSDTPDDGPPGCTPADGGAVKDGPWIECVAAKQGNVASPTRKGLNNRLTRPNDCGSDFLDTVIEDTNVPGLYEAKDCDDDAEGLQPSPRLVTIFVLKNAPNTGGGDKGEPILNFAAFFIEGCSKDGIGAETVCDDASDSDGDGKVNDGCPKHGDPEEGSDCNNNSDDDGDNDINDGCPSVVMPADLEPPNQLTPQEKVCDANSPGQQVLYGRFLELTCAGCALGHPNPSSTMFSIALVDWEGGGGTPGPTVAPTSPPPTVAPTTPPVATDTPVPPPTPTPKHTPKPTKTPNKP